MKNLRNITILTAALALGACQSAPREPAKPVYYVNAKITSVERAPEICSYIKDKRAGKQLIGGIAGGVVGNQFGSGKGRVAMTLLGAVVGVSVTSDKKRGGEDHKLECKRDGYVAKVHYIHPVTQQFVSTLLPLDRKIYADYINIPVN